MPGGDIPAMGGGDAARPIPGGMDVIELGGRGKLGISIPEIQGSAWCSQ